MSTKLVRPRLLAQAARVAAAAYERKRDLKRFLPKLAGGAGRSAILGSITAAEATCEEERRVTGEAGAAGRRSHLSQDSPDTPAPFAVTDDARHSWFLGIRARGRPIQTVPAI